MADRGEYIDDAPISSSKDDKFTRWPFAERVARVIAKRSDPASLVVGIYGPWGDGKTSVLNLMMQALADQPNVIPIRFNPWQFESEAHLIQALFSTLSSGAGAKLATRSEQFGAFMKKYGSILSLASVTIAGGAAEISPGAAVTDIGERLSSADIDDLKDRVSDILVKSGKRIVVLIDDVDRLDRREIHTLLKLVKLSASFSNTAYVVAFDDEVVAASLGERYGAGGAAAGRQFLEKIIQVPLHLPNAEPDDLRNLAFHGVDEVLRENDIELSEEDVHAFIRHFNRGVLPKLATPRQVKRYLNAIRFAVPLLKGEAHVVDQLLIEAVRTVYPELYLLVRSNPELFVGRRAGHMEEKEANERARATIDGVLPSSPDERRAALAIIEALFPRTNSLYGNVTYGESFDATWARERRICSPSYIRRYFQYSVPQRDVPDQDIADLLRAAEARELATVDEAFERIEQRNAWPRALDKLFASVASSRDRGKQTIAQAICGRAAGIPKEQGPFASIGSTMSRAAALVALAVRCVEDPETRATAAEDAMSAATSIAFAAETLRWLARISTDPTEGHNLSKQQIEAAGAVLAARIADQLTKSGALEFERVGSDLPRMLWIWKTYGPAGDASSALSRWLDERPEYVTKLLEAFMGRAWTVETGLPARADFERSAFDAVSQHVDPHKVMAAIRRVYGTETDSFSFDLRHSLSGEKRVACEFTAIYKKAQSEPTEDPADPEEESEAQ